MISGKNTKFLILIIIGIMSVTSSCKSSQNVSKEIQEAQNAELQAQKEAEAEYQLAVKRHQDIQSKQTNESAKLLKKQQRKINRSRKRSWWDRLFNNKCDTTPLAGDS